jgi:membrane-bound serine protease (ClpP class)
MTLARYWLYQLPGLALVGVVLLWLRYQGAIPAWLAWVAWAAWLAKDLALYPMVKSAYERHTATGAQQLVGRSGVAGTALAPFGHVRVRGELWRARVENGSAPQGATVRIERAEGLTLYVSLQGSPKGEE